VTGVVETEVLPRLAAAHRSGDAETPQVPTGCSHPEAVRTLAEFVVDHDISKARALLEARRADGLAAETLMIDYLKPAARWLGELWVSDALNFTEVTIGVGRLQELQHRLAEELELEARVLIDSRHVLLAPVPGDQHTFGLSMVASFLRRDGWDVAGGPANTDAGLLRTVAGESFDVIGLSVACDRWVDGLDRIVDRLRNASRNPDVAILVGGPMVPTTPELAAIIGADAVVDDARHASGAAQDAVRARRE
jgi:methanogenic corrinoid protein MtbC1